MKKLFFVLFCVFFVVGCDNSAEIARNNAEIGLAKKKFVAIMKKMDEEYFFNHTLSDDALEVYASTGYLGKNGELYVGKHPCLKMSIKENNLLITNISADNDKLCTGFMQNDSVKRILDDVNLKKGDPTIIKLSGTLFLKVDL